MPRLKECPSCGLAFEDEGAETCPYCAYEFPQEKASLKWVAVLLAVLLAWPVFQLVMSLF